MQFAVQKFIIQFCKSSRTYSQYGTVPYCVLRIVGSWSSNWSDTCALYDQPFQSLYWARFHLEAAVGNLQSVTSINDLNAMHCFAGIC